METIIFWAILLGSVILPPAVDTVFLRLKRLWVGSLAGALSILVLWPLLLLLPPLASSHRLGEGRGLMILFTFILSISVAAFYFVFSVGFTITLSLVARAIHTRVSYRTYFYRPWITLCMMMVTGVLVYVMEKLGLPVLLLGLLTFIGIIGICIYVIVVYGKKGFEIAKSK